ncbi:MAG: hypothetical protein ACR2IV_23565 [Bryobacteraceae bacterium]
MSTERSPQKILHKPGEPIESEPHVGHGGTSFEAVDASIKMVIWSLAIIAGTLVIVFAITIWLEKYLNNTTPLGQPPSPLAPARITPPGPQIQVHPWETLADVRAHEDQVLNGAAPDAEGHVHVPINRAMDLVVSRLNVSPDAPPGITTPGGQGRDFSGSVNAMPPAYRKPQIQGEIRKHAQ